ncbi:FCD domain-containing protein [soil metagenome]
MKWLSSRGLGVASSKKDGDMVGFDSSEPEYLLDALRAEIAKFGNLPGERDLAEKLNVKRHRVRKALERLRVGGELPPSRPGRRADFDTSSSNALVKVTNPLEIIELRSIMEPAFARLAAIRASALDIARITQAASPSPDADQGLADAAFHHAVTAGARNGLGAAIYEMVRKVGRDARVRMGNGRPPCAVRLARRDSEHRAVAAAIAARDPDEAERAMRAHLAAVQRQIYDRLTPGAEVA